MIILVVIIVTQVSVQAGEELELVRNDSDGCIEVRVVSAGHDGDAATARAGAACTQPSSERDAAPRAMRRHERRGAESNATHVRERQARRVAQCRTPRRRAARRRSRAAEPSPKKRG